MTNRVAQTYGSVIMRNLTVGQLRKLIQYLPDDAPVVTSAFDHSYREVQGLASTALYDRESHIYSEDYGEENTSEAEYGKRIQVLIID